LTLGSPTTPLPKTALVGRRLDLSLTRSIFALALPVALSSQLDTVAGMVDVYLVGRLGPEAISAVGISQVITMVIGVVMISVTTGAFALVAQFIGAGSMRQASATTKQALSLVALISVGLSLLGMAVSRLLLELLSLSPQVVELGAAYLRVFFAGLVFMTLNFCVANCLHGAGDARTPLWINAFMSLLKVPLSLLLIFGAGPLPALGVTGAALASIISQAAGFLAGLGLLYSGWLRLRLLPQTSYRPDPDLARRMLRIGIPAALQGLFRNGSGVIFVKLVALTALSTTAVAAYSIGNQMERIMRRTSLAFGTAATTLVGQSLGRGDPQEAERSGWTTVLVSTLSMALLGVPLALFASPIMGLFTDAAEVIQVGVLYLYTIALAEPFHCLAIAAGGGLRGAGDTRPALYYTIVSQWLVRLPAGYALAFWLDWDINGLWVTLVLFSALQGWLTVRKFGKGEWKELEI
jgi:putative MATE family efflux protein